jgi:hypothetical protein
MQRGGREVAPTPGRETGRPERERRVLAGALGRFARQAHRLVVVAEVEPAGGHVSGRPVDLHLVEQALDLRVGDQLLGDGQLAAPDLAADPALELTHAAALRPGQPFLRFIGRLGDRPQLRQRPAPGGRLLRQ